MNTISFNVVHSWSCFQRLPITSRSWSLLSWSRLLRSWGGPPLVAESVLRRAIF